MKYDFFIDQVQRRARLSDYQKAVRLTHATIGVLSERLGGSDTRDIASQLPPEIGVHFKRNGSEEKFSLADFFSRVSEKAGLDYPESVFHSRAVVSVLQEAVPGGGLSKIRSLLPDEFASLFVSVSQRKIS